MTSSSSAAARLRARGARLDWVSTAGVVAFCLIMLWIPWERLWGSPFHDRGVYLTTFGLHQKRADGFVGGILAFITNEVLWDMSVRYLTVDLGVPIEAVFSAISFLCLYVFAKYLASRHGLASVLVLLNPLVVEFAFSQLRMALAVALLMLALSWSHREKLALPLVLLACCIHTASFLILFIVFAATRITARLAAGTANGFYRWLALLSVGLTVVLVVGPMRGVILSFIGDRRAEYTNYSQSILYSSFWILMLITAAAEKRAYFQDEGNAIAVAFLSVYAFAALFNVYNARFLSAAYPLIVSAIIGLGARKRALILPTYLLYVGAQWYYWIGSSWDSR